MKTLKARLHPSLWSPVLVPFSALTSLLCLCLSSHTTLEPISFPLIPKVAGFLTSICSFPFFTRICRSVQELQGAE